VSVAVAHLCGRGGRGLRVVTVTCDHDGCSTSTAYTNRAEYAAAGEQGWRRVGAQTDPAAQHLCPAHSGATS